MGFQEINIVDIVRPITKYAVLIDDPNSIRYHFDKALYLAKHGRPGPVWLDFPLDVQAAELDEATLPAFDPSELPGAGDPADLRPQAIEAIRLLNAAQRPVILVGNGVRLAGAVEPFLKLAEILQVPVLTTWKSMDFLAEDHPLYIGRPGAVGQRAANFAQQNSDCILILLRGSTSARRPTTTPPSPGRPPRSSWKSIRPNSAKLQMKSTCPSAPTPGVIDVMLSERERIDSARTETTGGPSAASGSPATPSSCRKYWNDTQA